MRIAEIFHSIQGEGALTGVPSIFIRTSGCNLRCTWCDTPYASWTPEGPDMAVADILDAIAAYPSRHIVLTGGEPMIARDIHILAASLRERGLHITIETAATIAPTGIACDLASLSPKLANSTPADDDPRGTGWQHRHEERRIQPAIIGAWIRHAIDQGGDYQLKFVVSSRADLAEIDGLLRQIPESIPPEKVFLMPEGTSMTALREKQSWLVPACLERGFRYAHRLHIELFGDTRGT